MTTSEAAWLTTTVQLGFVCGTAVAALLNLPDGEGRAESAVAAASFPDVKVPVAPVPVAMYFVTSAPLPPCYQR
jgi:hypothetical protein